MNSHNSEAELEFHHSATLTQQMSALLLVHFMSQDLEMLVKSHTGNQQVGIPFSYLPSIRHPSSEQGAENTQVLALSYFSPLKCSHTEDNREAEGLHLHAGVQESLCHHTCSMPLLYKSLAPATAARLFASAVAWKTQSILCH